VSALDGRGLDDPGIPDIAALRRRVLLTGALTLGLFLVAGYVVATVGASSGWVLVVMALVWVTVTRPLMRPVREVTRLRRRLAYQAWLEQRDRS
jgi:hypothetical protein